LVQYCNSVKFDKRFCLIIFIIFLLLCLCPPVLSFLSPFIGYFLISFSSFPILYFFPFISFIFFAVACFFISSTFHSFFRLSLSFYSFLHSPSSVSFFTFSIPSLLRPSFVISLAPICLSLSFQFFLQIGKFYARNNKIVSSAFCVISVCSQAPGYVLNSKKGAASYIW
jgi:hypothetical protein